MIVSLFMIIAILSLLVIITICFIPCNCRKRFHRLQLLQLHPYLWSLQSFHHMQSLQAVSSPVIVKRGYITYDCCDCILVYDHCNCFIACDHRKPFHPLWLLKEVTSFKIVAITSSFDCCNCFLACDHCKQFHPLWLSKEVTSLKFDEIVLLFMITAIFSFLAIIASWFIPCDCWKRLHRLQLLWSFPCLWLLQSFHRLRSSQADLSPVIVERGYITYNCCNHILVNDCCNCFITCDHHEQFHPLWLSKEVTSLTIVAILSLFMIIAIVSLLAIIASCFIPCDCQKRLHRL